jgi:hypothetical protein
MLGIPFAQLKQVAREHPVVVLVTSSVGMHAVIMRSVDSMLECIELARTGSRITNAQELLGSSSRDKEEGTLESRELDDMDDLLKSMRSMMKSQSQPGGRMTRQLARIWQIVVKPLMTHLGFKVHPSDVLSGCPSLLTYP